MQTASALTEFNSASAPIGVPQQQTSNHPFEQLIILNNYKDVQLILIAPLCSG